jgi:hypothetical protein
MGSILGGLYGYIVQLYLKAMNLSIALLSFLMTGEVL